LATAPASYIDTYTVYRYTKVN